MNIKKEVDEIYSKLTRNWNELRCLDIDREIASCSYVCMFGTGDWFRYAVDNCEPFVSGRLDFVCDNDPDKWGTVIHGVNCINPAELIRYKDDVFVFVAVKNPSPIFEQLSRMGIKHMNIVHPWINQKLEDNVFEDPSWKETFIQDVIKTAELMNDDISLQTLVGVLKSRYSIQPEFENYSSVMVSHGDDYFYQTPISDFIGCHESFIDIGAYTGDTLMSFVERTKGLFDSVHCFELDVTNYDLLEAEFMRVSSDLRDKIHLYNFGLGDENETVHYKKGREASTAVGVVSDDDFLYEGQVKILDEVLSGQKVTLIKMDVEGMETQVLKGSRNIISTQKPKMAISVYHKNSDIWKLPQLIYEMNPNYKFYLRHQACINASTILYCI